jgi:hypothetical protein
LVQGDIFYLRMCQRIMATVHPSETWQTLDAELQLAMEEMEKYEETGRLLMHSTLEDLMHDIVRLFHGRKKAFFAIEHFAAAGDAVHTPVEASPVMEAVDTVPTSEQQEMFDAQETPEAVEALRAFEALEAELAPDTPPEPPTTVTTPTTPTTATTAVEGALDESEEIAFKDAQDSTGDDAELDTVMPPAPPAYPRPVQRPNTSSKQFQSAMFSDKSPSDEWRTSALPGHEANDANETNDAIQANEASEAEDTVDDATRQYNELSERIMGDIARVQSKLTALREARD